MTTLIEVKDLHKHYGNRALFDGAEVTICEDQRIAVIGRNGAGKSTLCRILTGEEEADRIKLWMAPELRLAYLQQHDPYTLDEIVLGFLKRHTGKPEWECAKLAARFGLKGPFLDAPIGSLSGGYRTRVKLTAMLLADPNFIILDEPTNYLDLRTLILLERFLTDYQGGYIIVSHDREFLRRTCESTLEIENGAMTLYPGSVEEYLEFKEDKREQAEATNRNIEAKQKQLQRFIDRFKAKASKATQAKSKLKQLQKLKTIEIDHPMKNVRIRIPEVPRRQGVALRCTELAIGYPERTIAKGIDLEIPQGSRVAVLGDNGQGKTTFLRTIAGDLEPKGGSFRWGHMLETGYYAQHVYATLDPTLTVRQYLQRRADHEVKDQQILDMAGSFLFGGADVDKRIGVLSGGERARMVLAGLLLERKPVLLLDEPSNHLDFETVEALGEALKSYQGTLFFVSHDRTFVHLVATEILEIHDGKVIRYPGTYDEYVWRIQKRAEEEEREDRETAGRGATGRGAAAKSAASAERAAASIPAAIATPDPGSKAAVVAAAAGAWSNVGAIAPGVTAPAAGTEPVSGKSAWRARKEAEAAKRRREKKIAEIEKRLDQVRLQKDALLRQLEADDGFKAAELSIRLGKVEKELRDAEDEWLRLQEESTP